MSDDYSFEGHWRNVDGAAPPLSKIDEARRFLGPALNVIKSPAKAKWLDVGCGDGVHLYVLVNEYDVEDAMGVDISASALERASSIIDNEKVSFLQGDAMSLLEVLGKGEPEFDVVFSYGVLAYTKDWRVGLSQMAVASRQGGLVGFWFMAPPRGFGGAVFYALRSILSYVPSWVSVAIANLMVPFLFFMPTRSGVTPMNATWSQCVEVIMVNIVPKQLVFPERQDVIDQLHELGMKTIHDDEENAHLFWCRKE